MAPRPAPDLTQRRTAIVDAARSLAEASGWDAVTVRRLADELGVSQPVLYSAFESRQAIIDAVAVRGAEELAAAMTATESAPLPRMRAYLDFATDNPQVYDAMFSMPLGLTFAAEDTPAPLRQAFASLREVFPDADGTRAEVAWSTLHGLATLGRNRRLREHHAEARVALAHAALSGPLA